MVFVFTQGIHYLVWIKMIPETSFSQKVPPSFKQVWKGARDQLGLGVMGLLLGVTVLLVLSVPMVGVVVARNWYLGIAFFHGFNELLGLPKRCIVHS